jgi:hypothetical protein
LTREGNRDLIIPNMISLRMHTDMPSIKVSPVNGAAVNQGRELA